MPCFCTELENKLKDNQRSTMYIYNQFFEKFIRILIICASVTNSFNFHPFPAAKLCDFFSLTHKVQIVMPKCSWICGISLECDQLTRVYTLKNKLTFLLPETIHYQQFLYYQWDFMPICPLCTKIWSTLTLYRFVVCCYICVTALLCVEDTVSL